MLGWLADLFTALFNTLIDFLSSILEWILIVIGWCITALMSMLKDICYWFLSGIIELFNTFLNNFDFDLGEYSPQHYLNDIPLDVLGVLGYIGLDTAFGIIISAYLIRIALRAIPFVGSIFK
ncbi:DUF2523 family protein [Wohlfahrtiimonas larvae]|uniref:DUF2523 domain-containing protein n=1 Tax=Wohlfahrtiimonas larvae TaxID=1157986 RepID=A0ABP9MHU5_9GAMM|nr:DUF2523 family protein [Wohlfahrtiimonas larvae]